jgi:hypothetical protein
MMVLKTPEEIKRFRLLALLAACRLEAAGMRRRGRSASSIIRKEFGIKVRAAGAVYFVFRQRLLDEGVLSRESGL